MKKIFSRSLLAFLLVLFSTAGYAQKNVLCETFDGTALPSGWKTSGNGWRFQDGEAQFSMFVENGTDTLITPLVSVADLKNSPTVTMDYRSVAAGGKVNDLTILYRTAASGAWTPLQQFTEEYKETTRTYTLLPADKVTGSVQLAIAVAYNNGPVTAISYLAIENKREEENAPADFRFEGLTADNIRLLWNKSNSDYFVQYNVKVSTTPITDFSLKADAFDGSATTAYITVGNLKANTQYYAYVRYECEDNDFSPWAELSFTTPCAAVKIPYTENFEEGINDCYTIVKNSRKVGVSDAYPHNGEYAFQFLSSKNTYNYLFFPALDVDKIQDYQVSFYIASEVAGVSYSRDLTIGVAGSATEEDFQELKTISLPKGRQWEHVTVSLAGYKGTGKVLAFRAGNATLENHIFIDDVVIEKAEACPRPMFVTINNITYNSARISWLEAGNASEWNVVIATKPYADPADCEADAAKGEYAGSVTTNPYEASNLLPQTNYYVYVQSACAEGNWTDVASFTTGKPVTIPYKEGFDRFDPDFYTDKYTAVPEQWVTGSRGLAQSLSHNYDKEDDADRASYVSTAYDHTGSAYVPAAMRLYGKSNSGYYWTSYAMMPAMPVDVNRLMLSFYANSSSKDTRLVIGIADVQSNEIEQGKQLALGGNVTPVDTLTFSASGEWLEFNVNLAKYTGKGRYITFYTEPGASTPGIYIDDISIDYAPTCFAVQNLAAEATSTTAFKATWTETLNATSWNIKVSSTEIDPATTDGDIVKKATVNTTPEYVATGLTANTIYYVYVSPACGELWASTTVTTMYALTVPYYNDFTTEPTGSGKRPNYWITGNMGKSTSNSYKPYVYTSAPSVASGFSTPAEIVKPYLYFNAYYNKTATSAGLQPYAILPELTNANPKDVTLSFWGITTTTTKTAQRLLYIGVVSDPTDMTTLEEVASVELDTAKVWQYFIVNLSAYTGTGKYIVLYMNNQTTTTTNFYVDNLNISLTANPQRVTDVQVIDSTITETSAKLKWHENGDAKSWKIRLFSEEQTDPTAATPVKEYTANDTIFDLTGLTHSTHYYVYVQAVKGAEAGMWSLVHSFWTKTGTWSVPFYEDFNGYKTGGTTNNTLPNYYDLTGSANYPYVRAASSAVGKDAEKKYINGLYLGTTSSKKISQIILPALDKPINTLQMTMDVNCYYSSSSYVHVTYIGVVTADGVFHKVAEHVLTSTTAWEECFVDFSSYTGEDGRIAIRHDYDMTGLKKSTDSYVDNIKIVEIPQCKRIASVEADAIAATTATVLWKKAGEETAWNLKVSTKSLVSPSDSTANVFDGQVTSVSKALENLQPNTTYYVYVQSVRADKGCVGEWSPEFSFTTLCLPLALPYTEDFEGYESGMIPDCYTLSGDVHDNTAAAVGSLSWYKDKALRLAQVDVDKNNYCAFPLVECNAANELQLRMLIMPSSYGTAGDPIEKCSKYFYEVGVMTNPNDPATYVAMFTDSIVADGTTIGKDKYYSFAKYAGDELGNKGKYLAIKVLPYKGSTGKEYAGSLYIDEIKIERIVSCVPPTEVKVVEFTNDTVNLTWKAADKTGTFRIRIFDKANANPDVDTPAKDITVQDTTATIIRGLNGNTIYFAFVRKECSASDHSTWSHYATWHTDCDDIQAVPYVETFEACTAGQVPNCWDQIKRTYSMNHPPYSGTVSISVSSSAASDSKLGLQLNYSDGAAASAITPRLNIKSFKDVVLYFDAKSPYNVTGLKIEAVESAASDAAAIEITTIAEISKTGWQTYYLDLADYFESAQEYQYLRFTPTKASLYMDNIHITTNKSEVIPVQALTLKSLQETEATFTFTEATPRVNRWKVEYGPKGFALGSGTQLSVDTTTVTLTGLSTNTSYDVYVRADVQGATSYTGPLSFTMPKQAATLPYYYNFGNAEENANLWTLINIDSRGNENPNTFVFGDAKNVGATGSTALYIQHDGKYGYMSRFLNDELGNSYDWAVRYVNIPAAGTYTIGIKAKNPGCPVDGSEDNAYLSVALVPADRTPVAGSENILRPDGTTGSVARTVAANNEFSVIGKMYGVNNYIDTANNIQITTPGTYILAFSWKNWSANNNLGDIYEPVAIDSIWVEEYECTEPSDHKLTAVSDNSATLTWFGGANTQFEVIVSRYAKSPRPEELDAADKIVHETFEGKSTYTVNGLKPNTSYAIYQRTICSDGPTAWKEVDFTTNCVDQSLPFTELFAEDPMCWHLSSGVHADVELYLTEEMKDADEDAEEWNCLYMPKDAYVVLPDFGVEANRLAIQMNVFNGMYLTNFEIGVVTSPYDMESFQSMQTIKTQYKQNGSSSAGNPYIVESFDVMLHRYKGTGHYIVIKGDPAQVCRIKDLTVTLLPECVAPQMVEVTQIAETTAQLNWIAGNETEWMVALNADTFAVTENPYVLTNLEQGADYTVSMRAHCDETHVSAWTAPVKFTTKCGVHTMPMIENFEGLASSKDYDDVMLPLNCWEQKYTTVTLDSLIKRANARAFTTVETGTPASMKWVIPYQSVFNRYWDSVPHMSSDVWTSNSDVRSNYKWLFSPMYKIEDNTTLTFDLAIATIMRNTLKVTASDTTKVQMGLLNIAVTTDDIHFVKLDTIDLMKYDSAFQTVSVDLSRFAGETVRIVFNHGMKYVYSTTFGCPSIRINNMRMNCTTTQNITDRRYDGCGDYSGYGFTIPEEELPNLNDTKTFQRYASAINGCDTLFNLALTTVQSPSVATIAKTICEGDYFEFGEHKIYEPAPNGQPWKLSAPIATSSACDSVIYLYLTVTPMLPDINKTVILSESQLPWTDPENPTYVIPVGATGQYTDVVRLGNTCQNCNYNITINPCVVARTESDVTICQGESVTFEGQPYRPTTDTVLSVTKKQVNGCDSIITCTVKVNPVYNQELSATTCEGEPYAFGGKVLTKTGTYTDSLTSIAGCDSIVTLHLTVNPIQRTNLSETICEGAKYQFVDTTLTTTGVYARTLTSLVTGCDSIITLTLTVTPAPVVTQTASICEGTTYDFNGKLLSKAGIYRDTTYSSEGCMSITELTLTINKPVTSSIIETICEGSRYILGDTVLTTAGTYERTLASLVTGCDSIVTLTLYVTPASVSAAGRAICEGNYYDFNGKHLTEAGVYRDTTYTDGCMSITELTLTVNKPVESATSETICEGGKYQFGDTVLTTAGTYKHTFTSLVTRCDSVVTLTLTVTPAPVSTQAETICEGSNYDFNGKLLSQAGIYRDTTYAEEGCMSITELTLTVTPAPVENKTAEICEDATFEFAGKQLNIAGTYRDTTYTDGCMTITELLLTVNKIETIDVDTTIHIEQLPFLYKVGDFSYIILPDTTKEGTYEMDTVLVPGSCTSYHFNIVVKTSDAVDNIDVPSLHIYPTLINKGQSVNLILNAAPANNDVVIEIHDMVGQLVATYRPTESHVVLGDFNTAGIYFIRVLTDANISGVGRVVVK